MRIGKIVEDLDALAGTIAFKHMAAAPYEAGCEPLIVTASIDRIKVAHLAQLQHDVTLSGQVRKRAGC
jgi:acyl-coenzyme A thioesterase 9